MDRRSFLLKSASLAGAYLFSLNSFSKAFAFEKQTSPYSGKTSIALIIDDIGLSMSQADQFLSLNIPLTFAILPRLRYSTILAKEINERGQEIMLHQPMEPDNPNLDPGPGALYVGDGPDRIHKVIEENISGMPLATGMNNHMGSRFTGSRAKMTETLRIIQDRGLFFVDSRTSSYSKGYKVARKLHMPAAYRHIFLDNTLSEQAILFQLRKLQQWALHYGTALGIGHPFPHTANALRLFIEELKYTNISFVHVSKVLRS